MAPGGNVTRLYANPMGRILLPFRHLPHKVNVLRQVDVLDDAGGRYPTPILIASGVPCWVQPLSGNEQLEFQRQDLVFTDRVIFFQNPNVINEDILVFGNRQLVVQGITNELELNLVWSVNTRDVNVAL